MFGIHMLEIGEEVCLECYSHGVRPFPRVLQFEVDTIRAYVVAGSCSPPVTVILLWTVVLVEWPFQRAVEPIHVIL